MSPERVFSRCRLTGAIATLWIVLFASISALTLYAARYWKVPEYPASDYWESRLTGSPQAFLGSDARWHYFARRGLFYHGWQVGRVPRGAAECGRDAGVRAHIDELVLSSRDKTSELSELTGLRFETHSAWVEWWRHNRQSWIWSPEREQRWEQQAIGRWGEYPGIAADRAWYMREIGRIRSKTFLEILFFGCFMLLAWPVVPWVMRILWARCDRRGMILASGLAVTAATVLYTGAVFPHVLWGYGMGASTTFFGPGCLICSGPYPFHLQYIPGDTILYRQFLELVLDPGIRLVETGRLRWLPPMRLYVFGLVPYVAAALIIGAGVGVRSRRGRKLAGPDLDRERETLPPTPQGGHDSHS